MTWHCIGYSVYCITMWNLCGVVFFCDHSSACISLLSRIEVSARALIVLDANGSRARFNVKDTHTYASIQSGLPPSALTLSPAGGGQWWAVIGVRFAPPARLSPFVRFQSELGQLPSGFIPHFLLEPQPRFGDKTLVIRVVCPQNGTAVLKGLRVDQMRFIGVQEVDSYYIGISLRSTAQP